MLKSESSHPIYRSIIALLFVVVLPFLLVVWTRLHQTSGYASRELIVYPLLFGSGLSVVIILVKKFFLREPLADFNSKNGFFIKDIGWGLILTLIYFALFFLFRVTLSNILPFHSNQELLGLMLDMRESPFLLVLWFGPVLWIGIALFEELFRVFCLTTLWSFSEDKTWIMISIFIAALIVGLAHLVQGPYGIVTLTIKSLVSGYFFYKKRRLFPLVLAHVLYDGIQVAMLLLTYPR